VTHIELRRWADCFVIAPLSANSLAKLAGGMCDNLLTCVVRAWDFSQPLVVRRVVAEPLCCLVSWAGRISLANALMVRRNVRAPTRCCCLRGANDGFKEGL